MAYSEWESRVKRTRARTANSCNDLRRHSCLFLGPAKLEHAIDKEVFFDSSKVLVGPIDWEFSIF